MAFVLDPRTKDLTDPIPEEDMIEIRDYTFANILNYAKMLDREGRSRAAGGVAEEARNYLLVFVIFLQTLPPIDIKLFP
jgi:hypothetical protein